MWPLGETLAVAQLAFRGLNASQARHQEADDDGIYMRIFLRSLRYSVQTISVGSIEVDCLVSSLCQSNGWTA